jgi:hypothetical protein
MELNDFFRTLKHNINPKSTYKRFLICCKELGSVCDGIAMFERNGSIYDGFFVLVMLSNQKTMRLFLESRKKTDTVRHLIQLNDISFDLVLAFCFDKFLKKHKISIRKNNALNSIKIHDENNLHFVFNHHDLSYHDLFKNDMKKIANKLNKKIRSLKSNDNVSHRRKRKESCYRVLKFLKKARKAKASDLVLFMSRINMTKVVKKLKIHFTKSNTSFMEYHTSYYHLYKLHHGLLENIRKCKSKPKLLKVKRELLINYKKEQVRYDEEMNYFDAPNAESSMSVEEIAQYEEQKLAYDKTMRLSDEIDEIYSMFLGAMKSSDTATMNRITSWSAKKVN